MTREEAWDLLTQYNKEPFHLEHAQTVENTMKYFAWKLGYGAVSYTHLDVYKRQAIYTPTSPAPLNTPSVDAFSPISTKNHPIKVT